VRPRACIKKRFHFFVSCWMKSGSKRDMLNVAIALQTCPLRSKFITPYLVKMGLMSLEHFLKPDAAPPWLRQCRFVLVMCHCPEWQDKLQRGVDKWVGDTHMSGFGNVPSLRTVRAAVNAPIATCDCRRRFSRAHPGW
jgi:hypothetical protein